MSKPNTTSTVYISTRTVTSVPEKQASEDEVVVAVTFFFATPRSEEVGETAGEFLLAPPVT
jgi:hypothetical protein